MPSSVVMSALRIKALSDLITVDNFMEYVDEVSALMISIQSVDLADSSVTSSDISIVESIFLEIKTKFRALGEQTLQKQVSVVKGSNNLKKYLS